MLETEAEHDFIRQSQKVLSDAGDYFIAGSAFPVETGLFKYHVNVLNSDIYYPINDPQYNTSQSGNVAKISFLNLDVCKVYN